MRVPYSHDCPRCGKRIPQTHSTADCDREMPGPKPAGAESEERLEESVTYRIDYHDPATFRRLGERWEWLSFLGGEEFNSAEQPVALFEDSSHCWKRYRVVRLTRTADVVERGND